MSERESWLFLAGWKLGIEAAAQKVELSTYADREQRRQMAEEIRAIPEPKADE